MDSGIFSIKMYKFKEVGGGLLSAIVNGACELYVESFDGAHLTRFFDEETGLNLYIL